MKKFQRLERDEETVEYFIDGEYVGSANHDDDGWSGMESVDTLFHNIAYQFGVEVEEILEGDE